jgi:F0F1-type ATP synthase assembly protein I
VKESDPHTDPAKRDQREAIHQALRLYGIVVAAGIEIVVIPLGGFLLDRWWGTFPWLTVVGFILGLPAGLYHMYVGIKSVLDK